MAALSVTVASVAKGSDGQLTQGTAGGTITQGQPVYIDTSDSSKIKAANANAASGAIVSAAIGIAVCAALAGQQVLYCTYGTQFAHGFSTSDVAAGQVVYLDDTAGGLTVTYADLDVADYVVVMGVINADETTMLLRPFTAVVKA